MKFTSDQFKLWLLVRNQLTTIDDTELQELEQGALERVTMRRLGQIVRTICSDEQVRIAEQMYTAGVPEDQVMGWIKSQLPVSFDDLHEEVMLRLAQALITHRRVSSAGWPR